jgi:Leucine-rich repeat (LRR) protein
MRGVCSKHGELRKISLEHNDISEIRDGDFEGCSEVEELDLSYNNIATINQDSLSGLFKLNKLKILGNVIVCFDKKALENLEYIPVIEIDLRFLECSCQSRWVLDW